MLRAEVEAQKRGRAIASKSRKRQAAQAKKQVPNMASARIDRAFAQAKLSDDFLKLLVEQIRRGTK